PRRYRRAAAPVKPATERRSGALETLQPDRAVPRRHPHLGAARAEPAPHVRTAQLSGDGHGKIEDDRAVARVRVELGPQALGEPESDAAVAAAERPGRGDARALLDL